MNSKRGRGKILQRHRTADNLRFGFDSGPSTAYKRGNQIFSWDDDFWKTPARRGPQSIASSASTFEEVESLCLSKSSSDSMNSSQRQWDRLCNGGWEGRGLWNTPSSSRRFISRQSSTTSTSTSRSSGMIPEGQGDQASEHSQSHRPSIADTLLESMELLGAHGNLDLADKLYLEKIFHRVLDWNNGMPLPSSVAENQLKENVHSQGGPDVRLDDRFSNSPLRQARLREQHQAERRKQGEQQSRSPTNRSPHAVSPQQNDSIHSEKKRRRDLIIPEEDKNTSVSHKHYKPSSENIGTNKKGGVHRAVSNVQRDAFNSKRDTSTDTSSKFSYLSSVSSLSLDNGSLRGSPVQSSHPNLATYLPSRSFKHGGSFESTASPPDSYMFSQPFTSSHAERVLMGLGFGATEGFLPERFLRDWYNKISRAQIESQFMPQPELRDKENYDTRPGFFQSTPARETPPERKMVEQVQPPHITSRNQNLNSLPLPPEELVTTLPQSSSQDSKIQRLREYIAAYSNNAPPVEETRNMKMKQFASSRQKSLPVYLETLSEEDEGRSRMSGVDPFDKELKLRMFISDAMSSSGKSTNSENSHMSSNQSESDSMSSCSERKSHTTRQLHMQQQHAYKKHIAEQQQLQNDEKLFKKDNNQPKGYFNPLTNQYDENSVTSKTAKNKQLDSPSRRGGVENVNSTGQRVNFVEDYGIHQDRPEIQIDRKTDSFHTNETKDAKKLCQKKESMHSKDSLEVADIMQNQNSRHQRQSGAAQEQKDNNGSQGPTKRKLLNNVEPAMVSIVLEDVDHDSGTSRLSIPNDNVHLNLPLSRCSSSSLSPIPQSPVTVIEVGLDNQQDSLDTEGTGSSKETDDETNVSVSSSLSSVESDSRKRRGRSRSSRCNRYNKNDDVKLRDGGVRTSPLPNQTSKDYQTGRRLSLEVPVLPELRQILERQKAIQRSQTRGESVEDSGAHEQAERRNSGRRASFSEESPVIINEFLSGSRSPSPNPGKSGSSERLRRTPSPHDRTKQRGKPHGSHGSREDEKTRQGKKNQHRRSPNGENGRASPLEIRNSSRNRSPSPSMRETRNHNRSNFNDDIVSYTGSLQLSTSEKNTSPRRKHDNSKVPIQILASNESSPVSTKSAFRYTGKGSKPASPASITSYFSEVSETDAEEFPSSVKLTLKPRPISGIAKNLQAGNSDAENTPNHAPRRKDSHEIKISSPTLRFCDSDSYFSYPSSKENEKVHSISRAVQVSENTWPASLRQQLSHNDSSTTESLECYYACDRGAQCNLTDYAPNSHKVIGLHLFHKFTQTGIPRFEISCQTNDVGLSAQIWHQDANGSLKTRDGRCRSKGVNTVLCLIGNEHNDEYLPANQASAALVKRKTRKLHDSATDFQVVDETLRLIEAELKEIDERERSRSRETSTNSGFSRESSVSDRKESSVNSSEDSSGNNINESRVNNIKENRVHRNKESTLIKNKETSINKSNNSVRRVPLKYRAGSAIQLKIGSANKVKTRSQSVTIDERLPARFAPSTWQDAILWRYAQDNQPEHTLHDEDNSVQTSTIGRDMTDSKNDRGVIFKALSSNGIEKNPSGLSSDFKTKFSENEIIERFPDKAHNSQHLGEMLERSRTLSPVQHIPLEKDNLHLEVSKPLRPDVLPFPTSGSRSKETSAAVENTKNESKDANGVYPNVDTSKNIMVKMYELQQGLANYLSPCKGMYDLKESDSNEDNADNVEDTNRRSPGKLKTALYDFSNENFNTTCNFPNLSKVSDNRRFSSPAVCHYVPDKSHSKLSRLKYWQNSHQNSYSSLDIEVDFMSAGAPLGASKSVASETTATSHHLNDADDVSSTSKTESWVESAQTPQSLEDFVNEYYSHTPMHDKTLNIPTEINGHKDCKEGEVQQTSEESYLSSHLPNKTEDLLLRPVVSPRVLRLQSPLSPHRSADSLGSQRSTPEIVISPLKAFQMDFLQVPGSPGYLLTKAKYPSLSSSPTSPASTMTSSSFQDSRPPVPPNVLDTADTEKYSSPKNQPTVFNVVVSGDPEEDTSLKKSCQDSTGDRKNSMADSDVPLSVVSIAGSMSNVSHGSIERSLDDISDASMYPRLSVDSTLNGQRRDVNDVNIQCDQGDTGNLSDNFVEDLNFENTDDVIDTFDCSVISPLARSPFSLRNRSLQRSLSLGGNPLKMVADRESVDLASNKSLAGSDSVKDVDDMDVFVEDSRNLRLSSDSSYSEPILDVMDSLSQDSLSSVGSKEGLGMSYLAPTTEADELLQVSDYGGLSPSPVHNMIRDTIDNYSSSLGPAHKNIGPEASKHCSMETNQKHEMESSYTEDKEGLEDFQEKLTVGRDDAEETRDRFRQSHARGRRNSKDNWDVVQSVLLWQSKESLDEISKEEGKRHVDQSSQGNADVGEGNYENALCQGDESSGDECDKEIWRINLNKPIIRRLVKMNSDPVDKDIYCKAVRMEQLKGGMKKLDQKSPVPEETPSSVGNDGLEAETESKNQLSSTNEILNNDDPTSDLLEFFQKADLSDLQDMSNHMTPCVDLITTNQCKEIETDLLDFNGGGQELNETDSCSYETTDIARVLDIEFGSDEPANNKSMSKDSTGHPTTNLMDELEMIALFQKIDDFDEVRDSEEDGSNTRRCLLSQISEEETQSEDNVSDSSKRNIWQVRSRFIINQDTQDTSLDCNAYNLSVSSRSSDGSPYDRMRDPDTLVSAKASCTSTDGSDIFSGGSIENGLDDVFAEPAKSESKNSPKITTSNSLAVFTQTESESPKVEMRTVSPRSTVHKFALALMEDGELQDTKLQLCQGSMKKICQNEEEPSKTTAGDNRIQQLSSNMAISQSKRLPTISIDKAEEQIDYLGNVTKRNSVSHTTRIVHYSTGNHVTDEHKNSNSNSVQEQSKHVSTMTITIGDYRKERDNVPVHLPSGQLSPTFRQQTQNGAQSPKSNSGMSTSRRNTIIRALKDRLSSDASLSDSYSPSTDSMETVRQMSRDMSQEELKDKVRSLFLLGRKESDPESADGGRLKPEVGNEASDLHAIPKESSDLNASQSLDANVYIQANICKAGSSEDTHQERPSKTSNKLLPSTEQISNDNENSINAQDDLKARVKAMLLIDDGNNIIFPASVKSKTGNSTGNVNTTLKKRRVKVTTMFSQNSEESSMYFQKPSNVDEKTEATSERKEEIDSSFKANLNSVRTQISPTHKRNQDVPQSTISSPVKTPRLLRSRDSLLKLHQQAKVSSSIGSDSDSELSSALKNQGDYDIRERDLALGRLSNDNNDEDESVISQEASNTTTNTCIAENNIQRHPHQHSDTQECVLVSSGSDLSSRSQRENFSSSPALSDSSSDVQAPKVIIQQASEDNKSKHDPFKMFSMPVIGQTNTALSDNNDNHLHTTDGSMETKTSFQLTSKHSSSMWMHKSPRSQFLSPNAALQAKPQSDAYQYRQTVTRQMDPSHPELDYLNILPKLARQEENMKSFDTVIGGPKPNKTTVSIAVSGPKETNALALQNTAKELSVGVVAESTWPYQLHGLQSENLQNENTTNENIVTDYKEYLNFSRCDDTDASYLEDLLFPVETNQVTLDSNVDIPAIDRHKAHPADATLSVAIPKHTDSELEPISSSSSPEVPSRRASSEILEIQAAYKKSLSVTSRDSGFDSQGSPIDVTTHKVTEWKVAPFSLVAEEVTEET